MMKSILLMFFYPLFLYQNDCKNLKVKIESFDPPGINAYNQFNESDNGERTLTMNLSFSGKLHKEETFKLTIMGGDISSNPVIMPDDEILITEDDVKAKKKAVKIKLKLKPLNCLNKNDSFRIAMSCLLYRNEKEIISPYIIIRSIPVPMNAKDSIILLKGETVVKPFIRGDEADDGNRTVLLKLALFGKKATAINHSLHFAIPPNIAVSSAPELQGIDFTVPAASFGDSGCPVIITVPVALKLKAVDSLPAEEQVYISSSEDPLHSHKLIIRTSPTPAKEPEPKKIEKNSFSHACISGHNFLVSIKQDSTGSLIEVMDEKDKKPFRYHYNNYFHTADFSSWLLNVFYTVIRTSNCDNCSACANYLAERVLEELNAIKNKAQAEVKPVSKVSDNKDEPKGKDSASAEKPKTAADATKDEKPVPDTFTTKIQYDSSVFTLSVIKSKEGTFIKICPPDPAKCKQQEIAVADTATFNRTIKALLMKLTNQEKLDESKISPATEQVYADYKKDQAVNRTTAMMYNKLPIK